MQKKIFSFLAGIAFATGLISASAQSATVATVPQGMISYTIQHGTSNFISLPLTANVTYASTVTAVTNNTISVGDSPAPFTTTLTAPNARYFVKFTTGNEMGRVLLITSNTSSTLTLDTTDNTAQTVNLNAAGFSVAVGDAFEIFPADTLASIFGDNSAENPLLLLGSTSEYSADTISIYNTSLTRYLTYYFNTRAGCWQASGSNASANNTILYPYSALTIIRRASVSDVSFVLSGRVAEVPVLTKTMGNNAVVAVSTGYATDMALSQLRYGSNWAKGSSSITANTVNVWNPDLSRYDTYYQMSDSTWRKTGNPVTDQSNVTLAAGDSVTLLQHEIVSGSSSFLASVMPYSLN